MKYLDLFLDKHAKDILAKLNAKSPPKWFSWMNYSEYGRRDYLMWLEKHDPNNYSRY